MHKNMRGEFWLSASAATKERYETENIQKYKKKARSIPNEARTDQWGKSNQDQHV